MSSYPRLTRANLRSLVREITGILSADVITDARINEWLNESLYNINAIGDNLLPFWPSSGTTPILLTENGITYRFPGWEWDNTTTFPTNVKDNLYMESDSDTAPWNDGHFDAALAYDVASRVFKQIADDTARATEYESKYKELANILFRNKFLGHNARFINVSSTLSDGAVAYMSLKLVALNMLDELVSIDSAYDISMRITSAISTELDRLHQAYKWPFIKSISGFSPYIDIIAYGAAITIGGEQGIEQAKLESMKSSYDLRLDALKTKYLVPTYLATKPTTVATIRAQVRGMLNEHTGNLSDAMIDTFIDDAYMQIVNERNWNFLETFAIIPVIPGVYEYPILTNIGYTPARRVLNVYKVSDPSSQYSNTDVYGDSKSVETVNRIPHVLDGTSNDSKYRYDIRTGTVVVSIEDVLYNVPCGKLYLSPEPTEEFHLKVRLIAEPQSLLNSGEVMFDGQFIRVLVYGAALNIISFTSFGDKKLIQMFAKQVEDIKTQMYRYYELDASTDAFQIGETGLSIPKYVPHFRVN
jgi:hypothetical protein